MNVLPEKELAEDGGDDGDFNPKSLKRKQKAKPKPFSPPENARVHLHTLDEHHEHLLSASFDASFHGSGSLDQSSSHLDSGFGFDDNLFSGLDGLDIGGGIGDELARELGEGWGAPPVIGTDE